MEESLKGRRILITRTRTQASALAAALEQLGAEPLMIPTIAIAPPSSLQKLDMIIDTAETFHWLLFTSANAVRAFIERAAARGRSPRPNHIAAIGPATEQALRAADIFANVGHVLTPPVARADSLAQALLPYVSRLVSSGEPATLALVRAEVARDLLPEVLTAAGASVTIAPAYRTVLPAESTALLQQALQDPARAPDAITFTSSSTVTNFVDLLNASDVPMPSNLLRISIGPVTSATLQELHLPAHAEAERPTIPSLIAAMQRAFSDRH